MKRIQNFISQACSLIARRKRCCCCSSSDGRNTQNIWLPVNMKEFKEIKYG